MGVPVSTGASLSSRGCTGRAIPGKSEGAGFEYLEIFEYAVTRDGPPILDLTPK